MKNAGMQECRMGIGLYAPYRQIGVCRGKKAPLKRGLRPKGGEGFSLNVKLLVIEEKKPSVTASPCHLPFQGRLYAAGPIPPVRGKCRAAAKGVGIKPLPYDAPRFAHPAGAGLRAGPLVRHTAHHRRAGTEARPYGTTGRQILPPRCGFNASFLQEMFWR